MEISELISACCGAWKPGNQKIDQPLASYRAQPPRIDPAQEGTIRLQRGMLLIDSTMALGRLWATVCDSDNNIPQVIPTPQCRFDDQTQIVTW